MRRSEKFREVWVILSVPMFAFFGLMVTAGFAGQSLSEHFWTHDASWDKPPWYFIGQQLVSGLAYFVALAASLFVAFVFRRQYQGASSRWAAFMAFIWMGPHAADAVVILLRTSRVWDPARATTTWRTFDDFNADPARYIVFASVLAAAIVFAKVIRDRRAKSRAGGASQDKAEERTEPPIQADTKDEQV